MCIYFDPSVSIESVPWCSMGRGGDFRASHVQDDAVLVAVEGDVDELTSGGAPSSDDPAADRERVTIAVTRIRRRRCLRAKKEGESDPSNWILAKLDGRMHAELIRLQFLV